MFITLSKDKIIAYIVSVSTVAVLFVLSFIVTNKSNQVLPTSANYISNMSNNIEKNEYNLEGGIDYNT